MTTVKIEIPDDQAETLKAKAAAQGLSLERWFQRLASREAPAENAQQPRKPAYGLLARYGPGPSDHDIEENRRDMFLGFAENAP